MKTRQSRYGASRGCGERTVTELIYGKKNVPASEIEIEPNGKYGVWVDVRHYRRYDAELVRGKWVLNGNWAPNYIKK